MADFTLAVTNPIFIDADRDGKYTNPHDTAVGLLEKIQPLTLAAVEKSLEKLHPAIAVQVLSESKLRLPANDVPAVDALIEKFAQK
jgi:hypothetical protein